MENYRIIIDYCWKIIEKPDCAVSQLTLFPNLRYLPIREEFVHPWHISDTFSRIRVIVENIFPPIQPFLSLQASLIRKH